MRPLGLRTTADLSVSIVTHNTEPAAVAALLSAVSRTSLRTRTWVVDNSPTDALRGTAEQHGAAYVFPARNVGFGAGHNAALGVIPARIPYHLVLNPDIHFGAGVLEELHEFMELNPRVGWVMPRVLYPDGSEQHLCKRLASPLDLISRRLPVHRWGMFSERLRRYECSDLDLSVERYVPSLSGCFMFLRSAAIRQVRGFDPRYFLYMEDLDVSRSMTLTWDTVYYPHVSIRHTHAKGSYHCWKLLAIHVCSAVRYFNKWGWLFDGGRRSINARLASAPHAYTLPARTRSSPRAVNA
jgi:GT2 family glycosyltransferase